MHGRATMGYPAEKGRGYGVELTRKNMADDLRSFDNLAAIIARLRAPDGCPWDREQTHASLKRYLLEEAYETLEALDEGDPRKLSEELGDLLLQILLHAQIASEAGQFGMSDVIEGIATKLIKRHPHVFGDAKVDNARDVEINWEMIKQRERREGSSLLDSVPQNLPALAAALAISQRAAGAGFEWEKLEDVLDKVREEMEELRAAPGQEQKIAEFGDLLFSLANVARWLNIDPEEALRLTNRRFHRRFAYMEERCRKRGLSLSKLSLEEMDALWNEAKARE